MSSTHNITGNRDEVCGCRGRGGGRNVGGRGTKKRYCWNCGGDRHILQCPRTVLKDKEKGDSNVNFDDEGAFLSRTTGLEMSMLNIAQEEV